jgi:signal transduction histidine kinase
MDLVFSEFSPQRGCIMVSHDARGAVPESPETMRFEPLVVRYKEAPLDPEDAKIHVSKTILYHAVTKAEGVLSSNAMTDPRFAKGDSVQRLHIRSAVCSPVRFRERVYGAIYIDSSMANYTFTPEQLALMNAIGQHAGLALANAELYRQKLQSERLAVIGETVASLSHSIKNILQGLRGGADVVEMGIKKGDLRVAQNGWPIVRRNLDRIVSLTVNMLAFSRQRQISPDLHRVGGIVEDCAQILESTAASKGVALIADVDPEMPPVHIDAPVLHQAVLNLLTNAVEAAPEKTGAVTVRAAYHPFGGSPHAPQQLQGRPLVEIVVIDNGPGIPQSKQAWVFEPFNTTKGMKGTGLGLAVARRVAEQHGGVLLLESAEGKGAAFRMLLPVDWASTGDPNATHGED